MINHFPKLSQPPYCRIEWLTGEQAGSLVSRSCDEVMCVKVLTHYGGIGTQKAHTCTFKPKFDVLLFIRT